MRRRTTLYAAVMPTGEPVLGVYDFDRNRLDTLLADRRANGEAFEGERRVQITIAHYNRLLGASGWPVVAQ